MNLPKPLAISKNRVILSRAAWKLIVEALEGVQERTTVRASGKRQHRRKGAGLPAAYAERMRAGEHPIRVWRDVRGIGLNQLAKRAKVARGYISEIENGKKPGSIAALKRIADALKIGLDDTVPAAESAIARPAARASARKKPRLLRARKPTRARRK